MPLSSPPATGRHLCGVAPTPGDQARMAVAWIRDGLDAGMRVVWAERPGGQMRDRLAAEGIDWQAAMRSGQLVLVEPAAVLRLDGPADIPQRIAAAERKADEAVADGYTGLSMGVALSDALAVMESVATQLAFEEAWEELTRRKPVWLLCMYDGGSDRRHVSAAVPFHPRELADPYVSARIDGGAIHVDGEIDLQNADLVQAYLGAAAADPWLDGDAVTVRLSGLSFIDLDGVRRLLDLQRALDGRRLRVVGAPRSLRRALDLCRWDGQLDLVDGEER